jgi:hypothetical protein
MGEISRMGSSPIDATNFMDTQNTTNYDSEKFKRRDIMRNEYRRMRNEMNQTISQKADEIAKRWIEELKDSK